MKNLIARIALSCVLIPALFAGISMAAVNLPVHKEVLDNGLTVLLYPNNQAPTVSFRLFYVTGSADADADNGEQEGE